MRLRNLLLVSLLSVLCFLSSCIQVNSTQTTSISPPPTQPTEPVVLVTSYEVILTWDAPAYSPDPVASYTVYRSLPGENFVVRWQDGIVDTTYTDTDVSIGHTYDYFVVSVDANGVESVSSNIVEVTVP